MTAALARNMETSNNIPSFLVQAPNPTAIPVKNSRPLPPEDALSERHNSTRLARKKKLSGTSAYCEAPWRTKKGLPRSTSPPRNPWLLLRRNRSEENISATVAKVKSVEHSIGASSVSRPTYFHIRATILGRSTGYSG